MKKNHATYNKIKSNLRFSLVNLAFIMLFVIVFLITKGIAPKSAELSFTEHSTLGNEAGSVVPASCDSSNPMALTYTDPTYGLAHSGSHFNGDCLTNCPAGTNGTPLTYDPYFDPTASACNSTCWEGTIVSYPNYPASCPPQPHVYINFN